MGEFRVTLRPEVNVVITPQIMNSRTECLYTLSLASDGSAVTIVFSKKAWEELTGALQWKKGEWRECVTSTSSHVLLTVPLDGNREDWCKTTFRALQVLERCATGLSLSHIQQCSDGVPVQLFWVDALLAVPGGFGVTVLASPRCAQFIRRAPPGVLERVTERMVAAERTMTRVTDIPRTRKATRPYGALHLSLGRDCACLGVAYTDLPHGEHVGWAAHGHNLVFLHHVVLVLVACAALEDECRAHRW